MNLLSMLQAATAKYEPPPPPQKKQTHKRSMTAANKAKHEQAIARYKAAIGDEWVTTHTIESRLGMSRSTCNKTLHGYVDLGVLERRKVGSQWNRNKGYEWRCVK